MCTYSFFILCVDVHVARMHIKFAELARTTYNLEES